MGKAKFTDQEFDFIYRQRQAVKEGRLIGLKCKKCGHTYTIPVVFCMDCGSGEFEEVELPTTGKIYTFSILPQVVPEKFAEDAPYAWAIIELDDGTKISGWIPYIRSEKDISVGDKVKLKRAGYKPGFMFVKVKE